MSLFDLTGKVAVVTGSSRGIGKASVFELAEHGAKVVVSSRKQDACDEVADICLVIDNQNIIRHASRLSCCHC